MYQLEDIHQSFRWCSHRTFNIVNKIRRFKWCELCFNSRQCYNVHRVNLGCTFGIAYCYVEGL